MLRKQKEAKQKKLLFVLVPVFLLLMVWQGPGYLKMLTGGDEPAATPVETPTPTEATPPGATPDPSTAPPPSTSAPGAAPMEAPADGSLPLPESDEPVPAETGQLVTFDRFFGKDPFRQIVDTTPPEPAGATVTPAPTDPGGGGGAGSGSGGTFDPGPSGSDDPDDAEPTAAVIKVNGDRQTVALDEPFPKGDKLFTVTRLSSSSAWVGLVTGEFSNGKKAIRVRLGKTLNLVSQPDGIRYSIKLLGIQFQ